MLRNSFSGVSQSDNSMNVSGIQTEFNLDLVRGDRKDSLYESVLAPEHRNSPSNEDESLFKSTVSTMQYDQFDNFENYTTKMIQDTEPNPHKMTIQ